ncbi:hypothetical protein [Salinibacter altiplanensis]|uniref:hypothetical protein n=1 Tax=Salinibacter altiplanensis TaxID=1803181 RepID=UPI000C9FE860|nr:hypothetical protein [Salinibacter altiplanensis]
MIPIVSLLLNVVVTTIGSLLFLRARHGWMSLTLSFVVTSVPAAYVGGLLPVSPGLFYGLLWATLLLVAVCIFVWEDAALDLTWRRSWKTVVSLVVGTEREAAAAGAVFTWINSVTGLTARVQRLSVDGDALLPLAGAVAVGAVLGAWMGASWLSRRTMRRVLGGIIVVALALLVNDVFFG